MKHCELCKEIARTYCESDRASLCWSCDAKVHSANFLVARHSRSVLCHTCQSPTPWIASGAELSVAVAACQSCVFGEKNSRSGGDRTNSNDIDEEDENGDCNSQAVQRYATENPPPPVSSSSSEEDDGESSSTSPIKKRSREGCLIEFLSPKRRNDPEFATRPSQSEIRSPLRDLRRTSAVRAVKNETAGSVAELAVKKFRPRDFLSLSLSRTVDSSDLAFSRNGAI